MPESPTIAEARRYPVKGLAGESLERIRLEAGAGVAGDRLFAIARAGGGRYDPSAPRWHPKSAFLTLVHNERQARLQAAWDEATGMLSLLREGRRVGGGRVGDGIGQTLIEQFLSAFLKEEANGPVVLAKGTGTEAPLHFTDVPGGLVSLINLASVDDLERVVGEPVDARRFRGNLHLAGLGAWREFDWIGRRLAIGEAELKVVEPIGRCPATNVNPLSAARDLNLPLALRRGYGHENMGVYAEAVRGGSVSPGDAILVV